MSDKLFSCTICSKSFKRNGNLLNHIARIHSSENILDDASDSSHSDASDSSSHFELPEFTSELKDAQRKYVISSYISRKDENNLDFSKGDPRATREYIFLNQRKDANDVVQAFFDGTEPPLIITIMKKTQVGMSGLMIQIAYQMCAEEDDKIIRLENVFIITGMSNRDWERDMIDFAPSCLKDRIFHHGSLPRFEKKLKNIQDLKNALFIIDEIHMGSKPDQRLHQCLTKIMGIPLSTLIENNIKIVIASATPARVMHDAQQWQERHRIHKMEIPPTYIGHETFLQRNILRDVMDMKIPANVLSWFNTIRDLYADDYRIHFIREEQKHLKMIAKMAHEYGFLYREHNSQERLSEKELFQNTLTKHVIVGIKDLMRAANRIPTQWKYRIGSVCEQFTKNVDIDVQIQGIVGRMTGYWNIDQHMTGPFYLHIPSVQEYLKFYDDCSQNYTTRKNHSFIGVQHWNSGISVIDLFEYDITEPFTTPLDVKEYLIPLLKPTLQKCTQYTIYSDSEMRTYIRYRSEDRYLLIFESKEQFLSQNKDIHWGISSHEGDINCRIMPVLLNDNIHYIGIYKKDILLHYQAPTLFMTTA